MRKNIDLPDEVIEVLTIQAVREKTVFKLYAERILVDYAKKLLTNPPNRKPPSRRVMPEFR